MIPDAREKRIELILQQLEELPTLPAVAVRILEATGRDNSSMAEIARLLESDPPLTAALLKLAHRADRGVATEVDSVHRAISLLGFDAVRSAVLAVSVFGAFQQPPAPPIPPAAPGNPAACRAFDREQFWQHSLAVACCAELLAQQLLPPGNGAGQRPAVSSSEAFVAGLLHDIGKIALDTILPKSFARVVEGTDLLRGNIADLERSVIGLDHLTAGKRLAERWKLPAPLADVAWLHGQPPAAVAAASPHAALINLVTLADLIVRENHLGYSGNYCLPPRSPWADALQLTPAQHNIAAKQLVAAIEPRAIALGLGTATAADLYQQALTRANQELCRVGQRLATRTVRLASRAKFFDVLAAFHSLGHAQAAPPAVLHSIAASAAEVLTDSSAADSASLPIAAFSVMPGSAYAQAVVVDGATAAVVQNSVIENAAPPPPLFAAMGDGPILPAGDDLDWLLACLSPRLVGQRRFWIPLHAEGQCIGGVLWGAPAGEAARLGPQAAELSALAGCWAQALRTAQVRDQGRHLAEQLADATRRLADAQNEIVRSKMAVAIGEMAAGAAHEMNNPLAVISGRSQLLASQLSDPRQRHAAALIHDQSHRLSEIITELMDYARPTPPRCAAVELADLVGRCIHDAKALDDPADRTFEVTLADVPPVRVDEAQVSAALAELIGNAIQATDPRQGHIEIHAAYEASTRQVALTIADNGPGMDEPTLRHAFDPFFSAKPAGRRRGMGLPKALRWIAASGGSIRLQSRAGHGTRSLVLLPVEPLETTQAVGNNGTSSAEHDMPAGSESMQRSRMHGSMAMPAEPALWARKPA